MNIGDYFSTVWKGDLSKYKYSGYALVDKIGPHEKVLDVGCGYHPFKEHIDFIVGIDPYNDAADFKVSIEDFDIEMTFDAIFCLGSINFGNNIVILNQIKKVVSLLKKGGTIYWRQNPGLADHGNEECKDIDFFRWTFKKNMEFADLHNCEVRMLAWDTDNRIYSEWVKK